MKRNLRYNLPIFFLTLGMFLQCSAWNDKQDEPSLDVLAALLVSAQGGIRVNSASDLAFSSQANYNDNTYGLITTQTLERWISNWEGNRPAGVTGKLVILQNGDVAGGVGVIQGNGTNVVSYSFTLDDSNNSFLQTRNNGFVDTVSIIPDGERTDQILNIYGIDPTQDFVLLTSSANSGGHYQSTLRAFYALYYWGWKKTHLGVLNGTLASPTIRGSLVFGPTGNTAPNFDKRYSVRQLQTDNTILQLPLEDVKALVANPNGHGISGIGNGLFIQDARSLGEYNGTHGSGAGYNPWTSSPNSAAGTTVTDTRYFGTLKGAVHTPWQEFINNDGSYTFKTKAQLASYYAGKGYTPGATTIQLCRTNYRAQITGFAAIAILGYPTSWYDGGWIEWGNSISGGSNPTLPSGSKFAIDSTSVTDRGFYNSSADGTADPVGLNPSGTTSRQIILDDKAYLRKTE